MRFSALITPHYCDSCSPALASSPLLHASGTESHMSCRSGFLQGSFFFLYMLMVSYSWFLLLGTVGWRASLLFVRHIYRCCPLPWPCLCWHFPDLIVCQALYDWTTSGRV